MSAFDVAGALVWSPLTLWVGYATLKRYNEMSPDDLLWNFIVFIILLLASIFCIARLLGAHL